MFWIFSIMTLTGFNFSLWLFMGFVRVVHESFVGIFAKLHHKIRRKNFGRVKNRYSLKDVAALIPAHNEETSLPRTLSALTKVLPPKQIYVASDYSTDRTIAICRKFKVHCLDIKPNMGKARALRHTIHKFKLIEKYKLILISDADIEIDENYFKYGLPFFNDPEIAALAGHGVPRIDKYNFLQSFFVAYRLRIWRFMQYGMRFGQTWKYTNVNFIIPGAFSMYRTDVIKHLQIDAPGLIIEDFNMTFELQKKKLGKIAYSPRVFQKHQDPYSLRDYVKQVQRWDIGFFQTVKRHGIWPSTFWVFTTIYYLELYLFALILAATPSFLLLFILNGFEPLSIPYLYINLSITDFLYGIFMMDYIMTIVCAYFEKKPMLLIYGFGFFFIRYIDALIYIGSPMVAWFKTYSGTWKSPKRL